MSMRMIKVFISYVSSDESFAERLAVDLRAYTSRIFFAKWSIRVGESIVHKINEGLSSHDNLVLILSPASVDSEWVKRELNSSLMRQLHDKDIRILPVLKENCVIPPLLVDIKYADFRTDYNKGFVALLDAFQEDFELEQYLNIVESTPESKASDYDSRTLAVLLKRLDPIQFGCLSLLGEINDRGAVCASDAVQEAEIAERLERMIKEGIVERSSSKDGVCFVLTELGKIAYALISKGMNEGILSPVCSH
jgi:hypothetical protein